MLYYPACYLSHAVKSPYFNVSNIKQCTVFAACPQMIQLQW